MVTQGARRCFTYRCLEIMQRSESSVGAFPPVKQPKLHITPPKDSSTTQKPAAAVLLLQTVDIPTVMSHVSPCACQQGWAAGHCWVSDLCEILLSLCHSDIMRNGLVCLTAINRTATTVALDGAIRRLYHGVVCFKNGAQFIVWRHTSKFFFFKVTPVRKATGRSYKDGCPEEIPENIKKKKN